MFSGSLYWFGILFESSFQPKNTGYPRANMYCGVMHGCTVDQTAGCKGDRERGQPRPVRRSSRGEDVSDFVRRAIKVELAKLSFLSAEEKKALGVS